MNLTEFHTFAGVYFLVKALWSMYLFKSATKVYSWKSYWNWGVTILLIVGNLSACIMLTIIDGQLLGGLDTLLGLGMGAVFGWEVFHTLIFHQAIPSTFQYFFSAFLVICLKGGYKKLDILEVCQSLVVIAQLVVGLWMGAICWQVITG